MKDLNNIKNDNSRVNTFWALQDIALVLCLRKKTQNQNKK